MCTWMYVSVCTYIYRHGSVRTYAYLICALLCPFSNPKKGLKFNIYLIACVQSYVKPWKWFSKFSVVENAPFCSRWVSSFTPKFTKKRFPRYSGYSFTYTALPHSLFWLTQSIVPLILLKEVLYLWESIDINTSVRHMMQDVWVTLLWG